MMVLAVLIGIACTTAGLYLSYWLSDLYGIETPTGPLIIILAITLFGISSAFRTFAERTR